MGTRFFVMYALILSFSVWLNACKSRQFHDTDSSASEVLNAPAAPALEQGTGFAYGTKEDPAFERYQSNKIMPFPSPTPH